MMPVKLHILWARMVVFFKRLLSTVARAPASARRLSDAGPSSIVSRCWDRQADRSFHKDFNRLSWSGIPQVHLNHNYLVTGDRDSYWISYLRDKYFDDGDAGDTLSLGCGEGHVDRIMKDCGFRFKSFTGMDISPASIKKAQKLANEVELAPDIRYVVTDLNEYDLPADSFDFIYFFQSLHHIESLEKILSGCARALRKGGLLMVNDYVGPSRFQWREDQQRMASELVALLPEELRRDLRYPALKHKTAVERPTVEHMIAGDPSEAVRSADIESVLKEHFQIIEDKNWGGALNFLIFHGIAGNFDGDNPYHNAIVELLIHHENTLTEHQIIPSDFKFYIAKHKH